MVKRASKPKSPPFFDVTNNCDYLEKASFGYDWAKKAYEEGFVVYGTELSGIYEESTDFEEFLNSIGAKKVYTKPQYKIFDKETKKHTENLETSYLYRTYIHENGIINTFVNTTERQLLVDIFLLDKDLFEKTVNYFRKCFSFRVNEEKEPVYALQRTQSGLALLEFGGIDKDLLRDNYSESVLKHYDLIVKNIKSDAPSGRIDILSGPPGCGKTWFVRGLIKECPEAKFVVVQPEMIRSITGPEVISLFVSEKNKDDGPIVLVVEDGDQCVAKRDESDMGLVSAVLNMGDGILGQLLDIRIIVTSNLTKGELDEAITRPGRLHQFADFNKLSPEHASRIYKRETNSEKTFESEITLAEVYNEIHSENETSYVPDNNAPKANKLGFAF